MKNLKYAAWNHNKHFLNSESLSQDGLGFFWLSMASAYTGVMELEILTSYTSDNQSQDTDQPKFNNVISLVERSVKGWIVLAQAYDGPPESQK